MLQNSAQKLWDVKRDILHIAVGITVFMQGTDMAYSEGLIETIGFDYTGNVETQQAEQWQVP